MLFAVGFLAMFLIGGIDGAFAASPPVDFAIQDTYWIVAHIHYVLFGGSVMGLFAGIYYWFPKWTGARLNERLGKIHFTILFIGANLTFFPMHIVGIEGMPRRIADYVGAQLAGHHQKETVGSFILTSSFLFLWNVYTARSKTTSPTRGRRARSVGHDLAAAALQLRPPAAHPFRTPSPTGGRHRRQLRRPGVAPCSGATRRHRYRRRRAGARAPGWLRQGRRLAPSRLPLR
jgi:heme/copper-type cytochrome/quinol oxidase subunit 1